MSSTVTANLSLSVHVEDSEGSSLSGARVRILFANATLEDETTDTDGNAYFNVVDDLLGTTMFMSIEKQFFDTVTINTRLIEDGRRFSIVLYPSGETPNNDTTTDEDIPIGGVSKHVFSIAIVIMSLLVIALLIYVITMIVMEYGDKNNVR